MARYIDADDIENITVFLDTRKRLKKIEAPICDVQEVKHGKWIKRYYGGSPLWDEFTVCSVCQGTGTGIGKYCSKCGAKMDLEEIENTKGETE